MIVETMEESFTGQVPQRVLKLKKLSDYRRRCLSSERIEEWFVLLIYSPPIEVFPGIKSYRE